MRRQELPILMLDVLPRRPKHVQVQQVPRRQVEVKEHEVSSVHRKKNKKDVKAHSKGGHKKSLKYKNGKKRIKYKNEKKE